MAEAQLRRPRHSRAFAHDNRVVTIANSHDNRSPPHVGQDRMVEEELVG